MTGDGRRLVVAVCSHRTGDLRARWRHTLAQLSGDELLVLLDCEPTADTAALAAELRAAGVTVLVHGGTRGLSAARNSVLDARPDAAVLFLDDDVLVSRRAIDAVRSAFRCGAQVVGARLVPPEPTPSRPWHFGDGQMHLVGWHAPGGPIKTWGACMGLDAAFARRHGLRFDARLGRTGRRLESGDDTSFVAAMKAAGAREVLLDDVHVVHDIHPGRLALRYLTRRVYWQGRSEVRRGQPVTALGKEWRRYRCGGAPALAVMYLAVLLAGIGHELVAGGGRSQRASAAAR